MPAVPVAEHAGMCADTGRRIESDRRTSCFMGFSKNSALLRAPPFAQVQHALPCHYFLSHSRFPLCLLCSFLRHPCIYRGGIFCFLQCQVMRSAGASFCAVDASRGAEVDIIVVPKTHLFRETGSCMVLQLPVFLSPSRYRSEARSLT